LIGLLLKAWLGGAASQAAPVVRNRKARGRRERR